MIPSPLPLVAVLGGGQSPEHEVSLASAAAIADVLERGPYEIVRLTIDRSGHWLDNDGRPLDLPTVVTVLQDCAVVVPALHGPGGEDGTIAALCDLAGVPYVGSGVRAGALAMDKWVTKLIARDLGLAVAPGVLLTKRTAASYQWTHPVVVKPVGSGSSAGVSAVHDADALGAALRDALALDERILVETMIAGREIDVAVLGRADGSRVVAPALEVTTDGVFDSATKYDGNADLRVPADLRPDERAALRDAAVGMYEALGCAGVARIDFFLTDDGPILNEVNTMPGFTEQSQVPRMFAAAGTSYSELLDLLIQQAAESVLSADGGQAAG
jgi:D-alanine-D-alanine ligase